MDLRTLQILCVSGDPANTCLVKIALGAASDPEYEVRIVPSLHDSYKALESQYFDFVFLDLQLPGTSGLKTPRNSGELTEVFQSLY
ncbi:MAG: hypothetical protein ACPGLY_22835 [Rubripirellula sp.]